MRRTPCVDACSAVAQVAVLIDISAERVRPFAALTPGTQAMGGRKNSVVRATARRASTTGSGGKAESARVHAKSSRTGLCAEWHWQPWERQQSCLPARLTCEDGALVNLPAWPGQCPASVPFTCRCAGTTAAWASCHCKPMASCSINDAAIIQFAGLVRMAASVHPAP